MANETPKPDQVPDPGDRVFTRPLPGESIDDMAKRMAKGLIDASNRKRAAQGLPPLPRRDPSKG